LNKKIQKLPHIENRPINKKVFGHFRIARKNKKIRMTIAENHSKNVESYIKYLLKKTKKIHADRGLINEQKSSWTFSH